MIASTNPALTPVLRYLSVLWESMSLVSCGSGPANPRA